VYSYNGVGDSANPTNESNKTTLVDVSPPTFAGITGATDAESGSGGTVDLTWSAASDISPPITYNIYWATSSGGQVFGSPPQATSLLLTGDTVNGLTDDIPYYFVVRAEDSEGNEDTHVVELFATPTTIVYVPGTMATGRTNGDIRIWTDLPNQTYHDITDFSFGVGNRLAYSNDGAYLAVGSSTADFFSVYDTATEQKITLTNIVDYPVNSITWSSDDSQLVLGIHHYDNTEKTTYYYVYDTTTWTYIAFRPEVEVGETGYVWPYDGSMSPDGTKFASTFGRFDDPNEVRTLQIFNTANWTVWRDIDIGWDWYEAIQSVAWSPDGTKIAFSRTDNFNGLWIYDVSGDSISNVIGSDGDLWNLVWSPDGQVLWAGAGGGGALYNTIAYNTSTWDIVDTLTIGTTRLTTDGSMMGHQTDGTIYFRDPNTMAIIWTVVNAASTIPAISFSPAPNVPVIPDDPTGLITTAINTTRIDLTWDDNSYNETGFKIERKTGIGGSYAEIDTVGANVTAYSDTTAVAENEYYYKVVAYNGAGDSSYTNESYASTVASQFLYWNPADKHANVFVTGTNNEQIYSESAGSRGIRSILELSSGKRYFEMQVTDGDPTVLAAGFSIASGTLTGMTGSAEGTFGVYAYEVGGGVTLKWRQNPSDAGSTLSGSLLVQGSQLLTGTRIMFAIDKDAGKIWVGMNNVWVGDPVAGTGAAMEHTDISSNDMYIHGSVESTIRENMTLYLDPGDLSYTAPVGYEEWAVTLPDAPTRRIFIVT